MRTKNEEYFKMIEAFIDEYKEKTGTAPTVQEISNGIGVPKTTVGRYLAYMREHGMLDYTGHRNIQTKASQMTRGETIMTPILGKVSCGVPKFAEENIEEYVRLPVALFGRGQFFILRANGDSMIEADINDGDLVLMCCRSPSILPRSISLRICWRTAMPSEMAAGHRHSPTLLQQRKQESGSWKRR